MPTRKMWDYMIDLKKEFLPKKGKIYSLFRGEFIWEYNNIRIKKGDE